MFTAGQEDRDAAWDALEKLCGIYWDPLYAYVRRQGHSAADAQDLTQDFFARFVERKYVQLADPARGRFRTFLLTSLKHFLVNEWNKANTLKRGGGQKVLSLDEERAEKRFAAEPVVDQAPDATFDQRWATTLLNRALANLRDEFAADGKVAAFEQLKGYVWGAGESAGYADTAGKLGMSEGALKVAVHRLRQRFGEELRAEVARTVATPADIDEELRYLITVVQTGAS